MHVNEKEHYEDKRPKVGVEYAQAYVPFQQMNKLYPPKESLIKGTVFPELDKEYTGKICSQTADSK